MAADTAQYAVDLAEAMVVEPVALGDWLIVAPVAVPLAFAALLVMLRRTPRLQVPIAIAAIALVLSCDLLLLARIGAEGAFTMTMGRWLPPFGITFVADFLGVLLALTAAFVCLVCSIFATGPIDLTGRRYGFYPFMLLMMGGVGGSFMTGDIFNLYVWFEVFLISSFGLLILGSDRPQLDGAVKYAILNLVATTLFLIATGLLYGTFGTLNMADLAAKTVDAPEGAPLLTLASLYLVAFGMKAAAFPLHFWLPASYHTPRLVVGALFAALLTKVGVYALLRTLVLIFPDQHGGLSDVIALVAIATMIFGVAGALAQTDIRRLVGFVVMSGIGVMLAGLAIGGQTGLTGTVVYAVHSMLAMAALYLLAALMHRAGGSFGLDRLGGLYASHPFLTAIALILMLAAAGLPPGSGLWPKVYLVKAAIEAGSGWLAFSILASGLLTTLALGRMFTLSFWRPRREEAVGTATAIDRRALVALVALVVPILWIGLYPAPLISVAELAAGQLLDQAAYVDLVFPGEAAP